MCGIAGYKIERPFPDDGTLAAMTNALVHRGPDALGEHHAHPFHGAMRRLSINDLDHGDQPLFNTARTVTLFYNGEIYNSPKLRLELEAKGYTFRTHCDGEVICHLYDEYGEDLFEHLDGMFAVALWVADKRRLILARDLPGEKPLYYTRISPTEVAFASEIKSLKRTPGIDLSLNLQALWDFPTFLWVPEPETAYNSILAVPRGHMLIVDDAGTTLRPYKNRFTGPDLSGLSDADVVEQTRIVIGEAVKSRLLSDVPVGSFLSSGLDSSIVATLAAAELDELTTFSVGFEDVHDPYHGTADESVAAAAYAKQLGTTHHTIRVTADTFRQNLETFCRFGDQPFAVSSGLGILSVAQAAQDAGIKVLLSGDGADECFGGYSWYSHFSKRPEPTPLAGDTPVSFQNFGLDVDTRLANLAAYSPQERAWAWHYYAAENEKGAIFNRQAFAECQSSLRHFHAHSQNAEWSELDFIDQDRAFYLPFEMLRKVDRMTMAFSVEGRVPFVAPSVLSFVEGLKFEHMVRGDTLKWVLREAFAGLLPKDVSTRPKHGFNVPIDHWLKGEWSDLVDATFESGSALDKTGLMNPGAHEVARAMLADPARLNGHTIFCYVMLNLWLEQEQNENHR